MQLAPIKTEVFGLGGGLDLVSPALSLAPGMLIDSVNLEPDIYGGYRRMYGFERYDGHTSPSAADYYIFGCTISATIAAGDTITGGTSAKTAVVLVAASATDTFLVVTRVSGTFTVGEDLKVGGVTKAVYASAILNGGSTPALHATYKNLTADNYRASIAAPTGSGAIRGVWYYNGDIYCFRDNAGATACGMWKATTSGWTAVTLGRELLFAALTKTVTMTIAAPGVVTWTGHGLTNGVAVVFSTTGALPTGLVAGTIYYVVNAAAGTFEVAATIGGASITTSGSQSGTHTATSPSVEVTDGVTVTGKVSGATAVVRRSLLRTGTWTTTPVGSLVFAAVTGAFQSGEMLTVGGIATVQTTTADTAIVLSPGGRYEFINANFAGTTDTFRMYGVDGVNLMFEFDGTYYVPIRTGISPDTPKFIAFWKNMLICAIKSSVQVSGIGDPFSWTALTGAAELAIGDVVSGLLPQTGNASVGAMIIYTAGNTNKTYILYGNDTSDFNLMLQSPDSGAQAYTCQNIGYGFALDTKGVVSIQTTLNFGNFIKSTLTRKIQPIIDAKRGLAKASCIVRSTNQYRIFFSDGTGIILYMQSTEETSTPQDGSIVGGIMYFDYTAIEMYCNTVVSYVDSAGLEHIMAGGSNGMVYELDKGTSHDGEAIKSRMFLAFNSNKTPRNIKRYRRTVFQVTCKNTAHVNIGYELNYGSTETDSGYRSAQTLIVGGSYWDIFIWDQFVWDSPYVTEYTIDTPGNGRNIGLLMYGETDEDEPYTIHSAIVSYMIGRLER